MSQRAIDRLSDRTNIVVSGGSSVSNVSVYRSNDDAEREIERLRTRIAELETAFEGMRPFDPNRKRCPYCGEDTTNGWSSAHAKLDTIQTTVIPAKRRWFRRDRPAHTLRHHTTCGAEWTELPPWTILRE